MGGVVECDDKIPNSMKSSLFVIAALVLITLTLSSCQVFSITQQVVL